MGKGGGRSDREVFLEHFEKLESLVRSLVERHQQLRGEQEELRRGLTEREARIHELEAQVLEMNQARHDAAKNVDDMLAQFDRLESDLDKLLGPTAEAEA